MNQIDVCIHTYVCIVLVLTRELATKITALYILFRSNVCKVVSNVDFVWSVRSRYVRENSFENWFNWTIVVAYKIERVTSKFLTTTPKHIKINLNIFSMFCK